MNAVASEKATSYPMRPLKEVATPQAAYTIGDICFSRDAAGVVKIRQLVSNEEIQVLIDRRAATDIYKCGFLVIRANEKLAAPLLMGWLSTSAGQHQIQSSLSNASFYSARQVRWNTINTALIPVPPLEDQAGQCQLLKTVSLLDEYVANFESLTQIMKKMSAAITHRIVQNVSEQKEVHGWISQLIEADPNSERKAELGKPEVVEARPTRRRQGP